MNNQPEQNNQEICSCTTVFGDPEAKFTDTTCPIHSPEGTEVVEDDSSKTIDKDKDNLREGETETEALKRKNYSLDDWKYSKDRIERTVYFISYLSPHNLWKGYNAICQELALARQQGREEADDQKRGNRKNSIYNC